MGLKCNILCHSTFDVRVLKSDQNGIEICGVWCGWWGALALKSDQNGIEIPANPQNKKNITKLKSDQNGIEIILKFIWFKIGDVLKSDQNGIEILDVLLFRFMNTVKIRPKWD